MKKIILVVLVLVFIFLFFSCQVQTDRHAGTHGHNNRWEHIYQDNAFNPDKKTVVLIRELETKYIKNPRSKDLDINYKRTAGDKVISGILNRMGSSPIHDRKELIDRTLIGLEKKGTMHFKPVSFSELYVGYRTIIVYKIIPNDSKEYRYYYSYKMLFMEILVPD